MNGVSPTCGRGQKCPETKWLRKILRLKEPTGGARSSLHRARGSYHGEPQTDITKSAVRRRAGGHNDSQSIHDRNRADVAGPPAHRAALRTILERTTGRHGDAFRGQRPTQWMDVANDCALLRTRRYRLRPDHFYGDRCRDPETEPDCGQDITRNPGTVLCDLGCGVLYQQRHHRIQPHGYSGSDNASPAGRSTGHCHIYHHLSTYTAWHSVAGNADTRRRV